MSESSFILSQSGYGVNVVSVFLRRTFCFFCFFFFFKLNFSVFSCSITVVSWICVYLVCIARSRLSFCINFLSTALSPMWAVCVSLFQSTVSSIPMRLASHTHSHTPIHEASGRASFFFEVFFESHHPWKKREIIQRYECTPVGATLTHQFYRKNEQSTEISLYLNNLAFFHFSDAWTTIRD